MRASTQTPTSAGTAAPALADLAVPAGSTAPADSAVLVGRTVAVDVRYLKRRGIGISRYIADGVTELLAAGARLFLLTDDPDHAGELMAEYPAAEAVLLPGRSGFVWEQAAVRAHLKRADYDVYVAPANWGLPLFYRGRTRLVLVVHDLIPLRLPHLYLLPRPAWAAKYLLSTAIAALRADRVVAVSHATASDIRRLLGRRRLLVAYPPIPAPRGPGSDSALDRAVASRTAPGTSAMPDSIAGGYPYFVYNGGHDRRKNVPMLLKAFARLCTERRLDTERTEAHLVILGRGYERFSPLIERLGIGDRVHRPGYVTEQAKEAIVSGAAALVYPSRIEGFGLPVLEGLAAGVPVISGTGGSLREVGGDAVTYVRPLTGPVLAATMADALTTTVPAAAGTARLAVLARNRTQQSLSTAITRSLSG